MKFNEQQTAPASRSAWAVIPARGGSKGIPRKNLQLVGELSLVQRAIKTCYGSDSVQLVVVSTDDDAIAQQAHDLGATVVSRPSDLAGDEASSESAVLHALRLLEAHGHRLPEHGLLVQCTSPLTSPQTIDSLIHGLARFDSVFTARDWHGFLWFTGPDGSATARDHDPARRLRRQDLRPSLLETGNAYGFRTQGFLEHGSRFFGDIGYVLVDHAESVEVDTIEDLEFVRRIAGN